MKIRFLYVTDTKWAATYYLVCKMMAVTFIQDLPLSQILTRVFLSNPLKNRYMSIGDSKVGPEQAGTQKVHFYPYDNVLSFGSLQFDKLKSDQGGPHIL